MKKWIKLFLFLLLFFVLAYNILQMPSSFTIEAQSYNYAIWHYIDNTVKETGATNIIAAIIADYRAFDTLGETIVLFTSIVAVASILKVTDSKKENG